MALTIPEIITIAKYSQLLANDAASKGNLFGSVNDPMLGYKIYLVRKDVEDLYGLDPNDPDLEGLGNFLYSLCESYALTAQAVIAGGGGSVVPPIDPNQYVWYSLVKTFGDETIDINDTAFFSRTVLVGAIQVNTMTVNGQQKTLPPDFTFDTDAGVVDYGSNHFFTGDVIAMQFYRKIS